jgi:hypothetical protein
LAGPTPRYARAARPDCKSVFVDFLLANILHLHHSGPLTCLLISVFEKKIRNIAKFLILNSHSFFIWTTPVRSATFLILFSFENSYFFEIFTSKFSLLLKIRKTRVQSFTFPLVFLSKSFYNIENFYIKFP